MAAPVIILVRPQLGENIGAVARAMSNFGFSELRLVSPKNGWPNERAYDMASGADSILDALTLHHTVAEAMHDITFAVATTARPRFMEKAITTPGDAALLLHREHNAGRRCAILFGPERTGLENDELVLADALVTIPTDTLNYSLNLSQAAVILAYEWCVKRADAARVTRPAQTEPPASKQELQAFFDQLEEYLDAVDHFRTPEKKPLMWRNTQNIFVRAQLNAQEVRSLRGMVRALFVRRKEDAEK